MSRWYRFAVLLGLIALVSAALVPFGCGQPDPPPTDYSRQPDPKNPAPYISPDHKNAFSPPAQGPTQPNPRQKSPPK